MASIHIKDMSVSYNRGKSYVLDKLNLDVKDGEFCVFLGPSGCGKSTAMHCIAGLLHPAQGEIRFGDEVMTRAGEHGKDKTFVPPQERNIAMVFQEYALYPNMTVRENMSFALKTKKAPKEEINKRVDYMAKMLSIEQLLNRRPAGSASGWPWAAPWSVTPRYSCWTNPWATWTPSCGTRCATSSRKSSCNWASPPFT